MLQIGVLGQCNRLGRLTAKNGAKADRIPQTTRQACLPPNWPEGRGVIQQAERAGDSDQKGGEAGTKYGSRRRTPVRARPEGIARGREISRNVNFYLQQTMIRS